MYCKIFYEEDGVNKEWAIDANSEKDNYNTLLYHLHKYKPKAQYLGFQMGLAPTKILQDDDYSPEEV